MSDGETFLARWSRRKNAAAAETVDAEFPTKPALGAPEAPVEGGVPTEGMAGVEGSRGNDAAPATRRPDAVVPLFDPASLPSIESIVADTDIRAFLAPGVPPELARAALRRAWAADPKIRDFVGLADYDWDFNAPGSMAGFGPLEMTEELRQIAARIILQSPLAKPVVESGSDDLGRMEPRGEIPALAHDTTEQDVDVTEPPSESEPRVAAAQGSSDATEKSQLVVGPRHGGALPK
jgi:Protein of unknown function (DUF3306)